MRKIWMKMLLCIGMLLAAANLAAAEELTGTELRLPISYTISDNEVSGLGDEPLVFLAGSSYTFSVSEAGADNDNPLIGDERYVYKYWSLTENPTLAQIHRDKALSSSVEIVRWGVYTLYVWFQKFEYGYAGWEKAGEPEALEVTFRIRDPYADNLSGTKFEKGCFLYKIVSYDKAVCRKVLLKKKVQTIPAEVKYQGRLYRLVRVGEKAFMNDRKLRKITIGENVVGIGENAFRSCKKLHTVVILSDKIVGIGENAFKGTRSDLVVIVPSNKVKPYKKLLKKAGFKGKVVSDLLR